MADVTTTTAPDAEPKMVFTFEEQVISYSSLYAMALICVIWGSYRSRCLIQKTVSKKRNIEASIGTCDAAKFPINASLVLFGLYVIFKGPHEVSTQLITKLESFKAPEQVLFPFEKVRDYFAKNTTTTDSVPFYSKWISHARDYHPAVGESIDYVHERVHPYVPELNKQNGAFLLLCLLCFEGCSALAVLFKPFVAFFLRLLPIGNRWPKKNTTYLWSLRKAKEAMEEGEIPHANIDKTEDLFHIEYDTHYLITLLFTSAVGICHIYQRHWITNNLLGVAFSIYGIENLHLASFKAGLILLSGLFFYDIFWVFGTDVMTTVAKTIDAPILLQFPQDLLRNGWLDANKYGMLGLGDIVIPGIFVALLYRFDHYVGQKKTEKSKSRFYFASVVFGYMVGLVVTMGVMHHFKAAQPALLYLVPSCVIIPLFLALIRGEFNELWNYTEEHLVDPEGEKEKQSNKKNQKKKDKKSD